MHVVFLPAVFRHFERDHMDFVLVSVNVPLYCHLMTLVLLYCVWV